MQNGGGGVKKAGLGEQINKVGGKKEKKNLQKHG